jgi:hypothetical protein
MLGAYPIIAHFADNVELFMRTYIEPNGATQEARFSSYCRLLPPQQIAKLLEER